MFWISFASDGVFYVLEWHISTMRFVLKQYVAKTMDKTCIWGWPASNAVVPKYFFFGIISKVRCSHQDFAWYLRCKGVHYRNIKYNQHILMRVWQELYHRMGASHVPCGIHIEHLWIFRKLFKKHFHSEQLLLMYFKNVFSMTICNRSCLFKTRCTTSFYNPKQVDKNRSVNIYDKHFSYTAQRSQNS